MSFMQKKYLRDNTYLDYLNKNRSKESEEKETES